MENTQTNDDSPRPSPMIALFWITLIMRQPDLANMLQALLLAIMCIQGLF